MINGNHIVGIIPAREGSKGIPLKNTKLLAGKPLIGWTIETARKSKFIDQVIVSTEAESIARLSRRLGAEVPFMRPHELATDTSTRMDVVLHAIEHLPHANVIVFLQPTSPLRLPEDIDKAIEMWYNRRLPVVSVTKANKPPQWMYYLAEDHAMTPVISTSCQTTNRQEIISPYVLNGAIYIADIDFLKANKEFIVPSKTLAYEMPAERSIDIDSYIDWLLSESIIAQNQWKCPVDC